jgi:hypothetical protein
MTSSNSAVRISHFCHHTFVCGLVTCLHASNLHKALISVMPLYSVPIHWQLGNVNWLLTIPNPNALATWGVEETQGQKNPLIISYTWIVHNFVQHCSTPTRVLIKIIILKSAWEQNFRFEKLPKIGTTQTIHFSKKRIIQ